MAVSMQNQKNDSGFNFIRVSQLFWFFDQANKFLYCMKLSVTLPHIVYRILDYCEQVWTVVSGWLKTAVIVYRTDMTRWRILTLG